MTQQFDRSHLPFRPVARAIIHHDGKILLGKSSYNGKTFYTFPGGGVEKGDTVEETITKECLEEVGVKVKNIQHLGVNLAAEHPMGVKREKLFKGTDNHYYSAEFAGYDKRSLNSEGDALIYTWETPVSAIKLIKQTDDPFNEVRIKAIIAFEAKNTRSPNPIWVKW